MQAQAMALTGMVDFSKTPDVKWVPAPSGDGALTGIEWMGEKGRASIWSMSLRELVASDGLYKGNAGPMERWACGSYERFENAARCLSSGIAAPDVLAGADAVRDKLDAKLRGVRLTERFPARKRKPVLSYSGKFVLSRVLANDPRWAIRHQRGKNLPTLRLGVNISISGAVGEERELGMLGQVLCSVAEAAESRLGLSVEIVGLIASRARGISDSIYGGKRDVEDWVILFPLKQAGDKLDRQRILSVTSMAGCRLVDFGAGERVAGPRRFNGMPKLPSKDVQAALRLHGVLGKTPDAANPTVENIAVRAEGFLTDSLDRAFGRV